MTEIFAGTHQFLSPEIVEGAAEFDGEMGILIFNLVDIWACGVTLYNMISGTLPYDVDAEGNYLELYDKIAHTDWTMPIEATDDIQDLLKGMLNKNPNERLQVNAILNHCWTKAYYYRARKLAPILAYRHKDADSIENELDNSEQVGCKTTMTPFLSQMFGAEIEKIIQESGSMLNWGQDEINSAQELASHVFIS